jgi:glyoxylase-like metal-dependent hydrolase (beta-lactamase superfamily II)
LFETAVAALGGADRIAAVESLVMEGTGQAPNLGQNRTPEDENPVWEITWFRWDLEPEGRMRTRQVREARFLFAGATTQRRDNGIDQTRGFTVGDDGALTPLSADQSRDLRREFLHHPLTLARAALRSSTTFRVVGDRETNGAPRAEDRAIGVSLESGETMLLELDPGTGLPAAVVSEGAHPNLGDVAIRTEFVDYVEVDGIMLPRRLTRYLDRFLDLDLELEIPEVDAESEIPPTEILATIPPAPNLFAVTVGVERVADGIWWLHGSGNHRSVLFEFEDHLTLFEVYGSEANALAVIAKARELVPGKPVTEAIVSHHHFDHTGGLRAAVSEGLTVIVQRGNEAFIREVTARPARLFPDALGRSPRPLTLRLVDDHLALRDGRMAIDVYRVVANSHMADGLMVHVPGERLLVQGDLFDVGWEIYWWGSSYMDNVRYRDLQVDRDLPVHGRILPIGEVEQGIARQIARAQQLCASVAAAGLTMRGCPVKTTVDR